MGVLATCGTVFPQHVLDKLKQVIPYCCAVHEFA